MKRLAVGLALVAASLAVLAQTSTPSWVGSQAPGTFGDATGHSTQSHLVYAANANVWWLFTLTSTADSSGGSNHLVKSFHSSGPDLATATWSAGADSPPAIAGQSNDFMGGGRALAVAYLDNAPIDVIHADISMAFDGQNGRTGHIRAKVTGTTITWEPWNYFDEPAAVWTLPRGNAIGVSTGRFIHTGGPILQQEVDANVRKSLAADSGASWTPGFSQPAVVDGSMTNAANALAFAPLASDAMLAVYDNGQDKEPNLTNLRYKKSNANGSWPSIVIGSQTGGDGNVFATPATIDQNDWTLVPVNTATIYAFRRAAAGAGVNGAKYNPATNAWSALSPAPPPFAAGQGFKSGAGLFGATDHDSLWLFVINTDAANSVLYTAFNGTQWTPWATVPGTGSGTQTRNFISGYPVVASNQVGLIWTEGTGLFNLAATSLIVGSDTTPPTVSMLAPVAGATVFDTVPVAASTADDIGVAGVQFTLDGANLGAELTTAPYAVDWDTHATPNGRHTLAAVARDAAGNKTAATVSVTVNNDLTAPAVAITAPANGATVNGSAVTVSATATDNIGVAGVQFQVDGVSLGAELTAAPYSVSWNSVTADVGLHTLTVVARDAAGNTATAAAITVTVSNTAAVPSVVGLTQADATTSITAAGLAVGAVTTTASTTVPTGSVISETPIAGTQIATGSAVALVISSGPPQVAVPNVVGLTQSAATTAITAANLTVGAVTTTSSTTVRAGSVISETPIAGTQVTTGSAVALVVSSGLPQMAVPNVVGLTQSAATTAITAANLTVGAVTTASSSTVPAGSVIYQAPLAGTQVTTGSAVALVVSSGLPQVAVPNVVGLTQSAATTAITAANLTVGAVTTASSSTVPAGSVIYQAPLAGTQVTTGSAVAFVVSSGLPQVAVPNVVGLTQSAATTAISAANLTVGAVTTASSSAVPAGSVIGQTPLAGTQVTTGSAVALVVSSGPPQVAVPNVVGLTQSAATTAITAANLTVGAVTTASSSTVPAGSVISQTPIAGTQVTTGSAVAFVVSSGLPQVAAPNVVGLTQTAATTAITAANLTVGAVTNASSTTVPAGSVISETPIAGTQVTTGSAVALVISSGLPQVAAPNVVGLTQSVATTAITAANLTVGAVTTASSTTVPSGSVISETPIAGTQVTTGSAVALVVSSGPPQVAVPNVVGLTQTAATTAITAANLTVGAVTNASSSTVPAGSVISQTPLAGTQSTAGSDVALVVSSGAALPVAVDKVVFSEGAGVRTTPAFGVAAGELLVAFAASAGPTSTSLKQTLTVTGGGFTWTLVKRANAQFGSSEVWTAVAPAALSNVTVTATQGTTGFDQSLTVVTFVGASGSGASAAASAMTGPTTVSLTTTRAGSLVYGVANDSARAVARTLGTGQTLMHQFVDVAAIQTFWVQAVTGVVPNSGTVATINDMVPTSDRWNIAAVEILAGGSATLLPVPDVVAMTQSAAASVVTSAGLTVGTVTATASATVPSGTVISQTPVADTLVSPGGAVALVVSSGPPAVSTPNVVGLTQAAATSAITNATLTVGAVTTASSSTVPSGIVISETPVAGTSVSPGSAVALVVSSGPPAVSTPNVVGLTQAAATSAITNATLAVGAVTTASSSTVPSGIVISETPVAGTSVSPGSAVALVVSSGPPAVSAPNVVGLTQAAATSAITNATLAVGAVTTASSSTVPSGIVISETPVAGTSASPGSAVALVVSSGPPAVSTPNVVGLTQAAATSAITNATLTVGAVTTASSSTVPSGIVISQTPIAGTSVSPGSAVALVVSSGPPPVATPNVVGLTQAAATAAITNETLTLGAITTAASTTVPPGLVMSQTPAADTLVAPGSAVAIVVSSGQPAGGVDTIVFSDGTDRRVTPPFSTSAPGELLLAFVASDGPTNPFAQTATVSGAGLTWTLVRRSNMQVGTSEIWSAIAPTQLTNVTVSATQAVGAKINQSLTVVAFTGTASVGAVAAANGSRSAPSVSLTATSAGSFVWAVGNDPIRKIARTPGINQSIVHQWVDADANETLWVQSTNGSVEAAGTVVTINDTAPTTGDWNLAAVEIVFR